jgi:aspartyl/glutamyl-tRNA(Asn/Gln) amidotransferase C subunit
MYVKTAGTARGERRKLFASDALRALKHEAAREIMANTATKEERCPSLSPFRFAVKFIVKGSAAMKLDGDEVRVIAAEARLSLTDLELAKAVSYINNFLDMVDRFKELDLKNVEPFCFAESNVCPLREDVPIPFGAPEEILDGRAEAGYFKVPRIMEE